MRGTNYVRVMVVVVLVLTAASALSAGENPRPRPFWGRLAGEASFLPSDACLGITGAPFQTASASAGRMTHLGRTRFDTTHCTTLDGSAAVGGEATFTAANRDEVWVTYTATTVAGPPLIVQEGEFIIIGGTGRFEGASGSFHGMVYVTFEGFDDPSWPLEFVFAGTIAY